MCYLYCVRHFSSWPHQYPVDCFDVEWPVSFALSVPFLLFTIFFTRFAISRAQNFDLWLHLNVAVWFYIALPFFNNSFINSFSFRFSLSPPIKVCAPDENVLPKVSTRFTVCPKPLKKSSSVSVDKGCM